jgi:N6-adenosine-specific RNA methylase IME4
LVADVKARGLIDPIILLDGLILDGRNRARACDDAQIGPRYEPFAGKPEDALPYVLSKNLSRRHLNDSQRAYIAARLCGDEPPFGGLAAKDAAVRLHVKLRTVQRAKVVREKAAPEIRRYVELGEMPIALAAGIAERAADDQRAILDEAAKAGGPISRRALTLLKQRMRGDRERKLGSRQLAAPEGKFGVIVEDFEWDHETWSEAGKDSRHASNHYEVATDAHTAEEIVARTTERFQCAADDCVLFMWTTMPHLAIAIDVLRQRGFRYVSNYVWRKDRIITGYWSRARHEHLLIGVKGDIPCPAPGTQFDSCLDAALGEHSAKPDLFMEMIERYYPTLPKIELNARRARPGWTIWGNEAPEQTDEETGEVTEAAPMREADDLSIPPFLKREPAEASAPT